MFFFWLYFLYSVALAVSNCKYLSLLYTRSLPFIVPYVHNFPYYIKKNRLFYQCLERKRKKQTCFLVRRSPFPSHAHKTITFTPYEHFHSTSFGVSPIPHREIVVLSSSRGHHFRVIPLAEFTAVTNNHCDRSRDASSSSSNASVSLLDSRVRGGGGGDVVWTSYEV